MHPVLSFSDWASKNRKECFAIVLTVDDIAEGLDCSLDRASRVCERLSEDCDQLHFHLWTMIDSLAASVPEDPVVELMQKAEQNRDSPTA